MRALQRLHGRGMGGGRGKRPFPRISRFQPVPARSGRSGVPASGRFQGTDRAVLPPVRALRRRDRRGFGTGGASRGPGQSGCNAGYQPLGATAGGWAGIARARDAGLAVRRGGLRREASSRHAGPRHRRSGLHARLRASVRATTSGKRRAGSTIIRCSCRPKPSREGAEWLAEIGEGERSAACLAVADAIAPRLDAFWDPDAGYYRSRFGVVSGKPGKALDAAVILAVLHAGRESGTHSVLDARAQATLTALEQLFEGEYAINRERPAGRGPALGRYAGDVYYSGGAYYFATLAAAEFYFKLAQALLAGAPMAMTEENRTFRQRHGRSGARRFRCRVRSARSRRCDPANGAGFHASDRRTFRTVRSDHRRADLGQASGLELRSLHHRRRGSTAGL